MKLKLIGLTIYLILLIKPCFSQTQSSSKNGKYKWKVAVMMSPCDLSGTGIDDGTGRYLPDIPSIAGQEFQVLKTINSTALIQVFDYTNATASGSAIMYNPTPLFYRYNFSGTPAQYASLTAAHKNSRAYGAMQIYFTIPIDDLDQHAVKENKVGGSLTAGVINFPFKYRPQKDGADFSGAFNFGAGIGYKFNHKPWRQFTYSIISGYSISNIVLDSSNTSKNQGKLSSSNNYSAFSFSLGALVEYQKVQAGIFIGWDRISKLNHREFDWSFQGKPWISIGFGIAIFSSQKEKSEATGDKPQQPAKQLSL